MTSPTRRPLDPSPEEIAQARARLDGLLAQYASFGTGLHDRSPTEQRSDARVVALARISSLLEYAAAFDGDEMVKYVRMARAMGAAFEQWTAEQRAGQP
jgi:hypothetical protein